MSCGDCKSLITLASWLGKNVNIFANGFYKFFAIGIQWAISTLDVAFWNFFLVFQTAMPELFYFIKISVVAFSSDENVLDNFAEYKR